MLSYIPNDQSQSSKKEIDTQLLRAAIIAELDAINLYEQMASQAEDADLKKVFADVAKEEKEHVGEFQTLLLQRDPEQIEEMKSGKEEVKEMTE